MRNARAHFSRRASGERGAQSVSSLDSRLLQGALYNVTTAHTLHTHRALTETAETPNESTECVHAHAP